MKKLTRREFFRTSALTSLLLMILPKGYQVKHAYKELFDDYDEVLCRKKFKSLAQAGLKLEPVGRVIVEAGKSFIGTDYAAGTLDKDTGAEKLVINLTGLDCVTFVENCIVFARCLKSGKTTFEDYKKELQKIRYRDGVIDGYGSRLHYFCDWIYDNQNKGIVKDVTQELGGVLYSKKINFMSNHVSSYKQLSDRTNIENIKIAEEAINSRDHYYIPVGEISGVYSALQQGDVIATTTNIVGLDVTHTGCVVKDDEGGTYFLHASSKSKQVIISTNQLQEYVREDPKKTGIMVARALDNF